MKAGYDLAGKILFEIHGMDRTAGYLVADFFYFFEVSIA